MKVVIYIITLIAITIHPLNTPICIASDEIFNLDVFTSNVNSIIHTIYHDKYIISCDTGATCPHGWLCDNDTLTKCKITESDNVITIPFYVVPKYWVGIDVKGHDINSLNNISTYWYKNKRLVVIRNNSIINNRLVHDILYRLAGPGLCMIDTPYNSCNSECINSYCPRECSLFTGSSIFSINKKINDLIANNGISLSSKQYFNVAYSCYIMKYPCVDVFRHVLALGNQSPKYALESALHALYNFCDDRVVNNAFYLNITENGDLARVTSELYAKCTSVTSIRKLLNGIHSRVLKRWQIRSLVRAIGEKDYTDGTKYVMAVLNENKDLGIVVECIHTLALLGNRRIKEIAYNKLNKLGVDTVKSCINGGEYGNVCETVVFNSIRDVYDKERQKNVNSTTTFDDVIDISRILPNLEKMIYMKGKNGIVYYIDGNSEQIDVYALNKSYCYLSRRERFDTGVIQINNNKYYEKRYIVYTGIDSLIRPYEFISRKTKLPFILQKRGLIKKDEMMTIVFRNADNISNMITVRGEDK